MLFVRERSLRQFGMPGEGMALVLNWKGGRKVCRPHDDLLAFFLDPVNLRMAKGLARVLYYVDATANG